MRDAKDTSFKYRYRFLRPVGKIFTPLLTKAVPAAIKNSINERRIGNSLLVRESRQAKSILVSSIVKRFILDYYVDDFVLFHDSNTRNQGPEIP